MSRDADADGRVLSSTTRVAYCEFGPRIEEGSIVAFAVANRSVEAKVTHLQTGARGVTLGHATLLELARKPPPHGTELRLVRSRAEAEGVVHLSLSHDLWGDPVPLRLNDLFRNLLLGGKTQSGKTHLGLALAESALALEVPHLIIDTQSEFLGLQPLRPDRIVQTTDAKAALKALRDRKTVLVPLLGCSMEEKAEVCADLVEALVAAKERAAVRGAAAFPPVLVTVDEAEIYAPSHAKVVVSSRAKAALENLLKRGIKLGLGSILLSQRLPQLNTEVRSQCNTVALFHLDDPGSLHLAKLMGLTQYDVAILPRLRPLECILAGAAVSRPTLVRLGPIRSGRTKNVDFEALLGLRGESGIVPA